MVMKEQPRWMLYGAYGTTGRLILDEALRRGQRPLLSGRDPARLSALAAETGLEAVPLALGSADAAKALAGVSVVLNAAGPFFETGGPLRKLCLEAGASYVDVNGEIDDFVAAMACDAEARARKVAIVPGAGFGVVFGEAIAAHVARRLPDASWLRISLAAQNASTSAGATRSTAAVLAGGGYAIHDGALRKRPMAFSTWRTASLRFAAAPRAELVAAQRLTGIREIVAGVPLSLPAAMVLRIAGPLIGAMLSRRSAGASAKPPARTASADLRSRIWAEAGNGAGKRALSMLETGEGYRMAAAAAVRAVERVLADRPVGALTPAQAFGAGFALSLPETGIRDL
jgi:short subunit dehydrogenase-like uncharacterized protein